MERVEAQEKKLKNLGGDALEAGKNRLEEPRAKLARPKRLAKTRPQTTTRTPRMLQEMLRKALKSMLLMRWIVLRTYRICSQGAIILNNLPYSFRYLYRKLFAKLCTCSSV